MSLTAILSALIAGGVAVALGAWAFTNAIEWLGHALSLGDRLLGGVLAAWGTALPELMVPLVAVLGGSSAGHAVGVGAILGAPFLLATLAFALLGATVLARARLGRPRTLVLRSGRTGADLAWFSLLLALAVGVGLPLFHPYRYWAMAVLLAGYAAYLARALAGREGAAGSRPERFALWRAERPPRLGLVVAEAAVAVALLLAGAEAFVAAVTGLGHSPGLSHVVLAVVLAPLATELPEVMNSVVWTWRGRDDLALGALTGAMVIQATIGPSLGILLTGWRLGPTEALAAALTLLAALFFALLLGRRPRGPDGVGLIAGLAVYIAFLAAVTRS